MRGMRAHTTNLYSDRQPPLHITINAENSLRCDALPSLQLRANRSLQRFNRSSPENRCHSLQVGDIVRSPQSTTERSKAMTLFLVFICLPLMTIFLIRYGNPSITGAFYRANPSEERAYILKQGCQFGLPLGAFFLAVAPFGNVIPLPPALEALIDHLFAPVLLGITVVTLVITGFRTRRLTGHLRAAALAGLLAGVLGFALFGLSFIVIDMVFFDTVRHQPEKILNFAHSGYQDMRAYLFDSTVRSANVLILVGGGVGAILGTVGGWLGNRKSLQKRTA